MTDIQQTDEFTELLDLLTMLLSAILSKKPATKITSRNTDNQDIVRMISNCISPSCYPYLSDIGQILLNEIGLIPKFCYILLNRLMSLYGTNDKILRLACKRMDELVILLEKQHISVPRTSLIEKIFLNLLVFFARLEFCGDIPVGMVIYNKYAIRVHHEETEAHK